MPRNYIAKPGSKRYRKYDELILKQALDDLALKNNSLSAVSEKYNISKSVLCRHKNRIMKPHCRPTALTKEEELYIVENINICGDWGYPLDTTDLRYIIKMYLDSINIKHNIFKNNIPGLDYVNGFLKRHEDKLSQRICQNIKRSRAAVSPDIIKEYFCELERSLENVPSKNIINYDETNLTDDPGCKKVIVRRGCKYPERIVNHSKGSISLMMAATANGDFLPPYVVYKAAHLYDSWTTKGPRFTRYNRSPSGWFDGNSFADWVKTIVIPFMEKMEGKKILIGDNLSSHLSIDIIKMCQEKNIHFIFLPANSTHLTQPLDVAVFRPMKVIWRQLLDKWKKSDDGRTQSCVPKGCFPMLLKLLMEQLNVNAEKNIKAGFKKCGIVPLDPNQVLARLPRQEVNEEATESALNESFLSFLKEMRFGSMNIKEPKKKRKLEVVAGKSVSAEELEIKEDPALVQHKKKKILHPLTETASKYISAKGKGVGKRTKPKIYNKQENDDGENKNSDNEIICSQQTKEKHENSILENPVGQSDYEMALLPFDFESMPVIFEENFDCQNINVRALIDSQNNENNSKQGLDKENEGPQFKTKQNSKVKIISDIKLKLPLPLMKTNTNSTLRNSDKCSSIHPKKGSLNFLNNTEEILKILEED